MHKYWGKKPFNEISKFIEQYSEPEEVVMDCFCGSGVTLIEALKAGRRVYGVDLNPIAIKLAKASLTPVDLKEVERTFESIKKSLFYMINSLYEVEIDGEPTTVTHTIWKNGKPIEVWYSTDAKRKKIRTGLPVDIEMTNNPKIKPKWYPHSIMYENSRINVGKNQQVCDLFTPRALVGLSWILDEIKKIKDDKIRAVFELTFSGTLSQASNLVFVIRGREKNEGARDKAEVGSWVIGYWVPEEHFEIHAWNCFENRLDDETWIQTLNLFIEQGFELKDIVPLEYSATSVIQDNRKNALKTDFVLTFQNNDNRQLGEIKFKKDPEKLEDLIQTLHKKHPNYEVYNFMNALFEQTIPEGYIYRVSDIVKLCAEILG